MEVFGSMMLVLVVFLLWYADRLITKNRELEDIVQRLVDSKYEEVGDGNNADKRYGLSNKENFDQIEDNVLKDEADELEANEDGDISKEDEQRFQQASAYCQIAKSRLGDEEEHFEESEFKDLLKKSVKYTQEIDDDFFRQVAYHRICVLLAQGGLSEFAKRILSRIDNVMIREKVLQDLARVRKENELIEYAGGVSGSYETDS